jgi:hypothetical protein
MPLSALCRRSTTDMSIVKLNPWNANTPEASLNKFFGSLAMHVNYFIMIAISLLFALGCGETAESRAKTSSGKDTKILVDHVGEGQLSESVVLAPARGLDEPVRVNRTLEVVKDSNALSEARQLHLTEINSLYDAAMVAIDSKDHLFLEHMWALESRKQHSVNALKAILSDKSSSTTAKAKAGYVLTQLGENSGEDFLFNSLSSKDAGIRLEAMKMLGEWDIEVDFSKGGRGDLLTSMMLDPEEAIRSEAVSLCVKNNLPGCEEKLVQLIEEKKVSDLGKAVLDLGRVATTKESVALMLTYLFKEPEEQYGQWNGYALKRVLSNPDPAVSEPIRKTLHAYTLRFDQQRYDQSLVRDLAMTAEGDSLTLLEDIYKNAKDIVSRLYALEAILRLQPDNAVERTLQHIRDERLTGMAIDILAQYVSEEHASRVIPVVDPGTGTLSERAVRLMLEQLGEAGKQHVLVNRDRLEPAANMWASWKLEGIDLHTALNDLEKAHVISEAPNALLSRMNKDRLQQGETPVDISDPSELIAALESAGRLVMFDAETGMLPCKHHHLLLEFAKATGGELQIESPSEIWQQKGDDDYDAPYKVQFVNQGKLYRFGAENYGDWYDVEAVHRAVNTVLKELRTENRFVELASDGQMASFVYANPAVFLPIAQKYRLPLSEDANEAIKKGKAFEGEVFRSLQDDN